jgi:hypothetical protein
MAMIEARSCWNPYFRLGLSVALYFEPKDYKCAMVALGRSLLGGRIFFRFGMSLGS